MSRLATRVKAAEKKAEGRGGLCVIPLPGPMTAAEEVEHIAAEKARQGAAASATVVVIRRHGRPSA